MGRLWMVALIGALLLTGCGQAGAPTASTSATAPNTSAREQGDLPAVTLVENGKDGTDQVEVEQDGQRLTVVTPTLNGTSMGESGQVSLTPFSDVMGYSGFCEAHPRVGASWTEWYYYALVDAVPRCIGESYGLQQRDCVRDLDGDGISELICTCTYGGSSSLTAWVFRAEGEVIYRSQPNVGAFISAEDYLQLNPAELSSAYEPETGAFTLTVGDRHYTPQWPEDFTESVYTPSYLVKLQDD